MRDSAAGAEGPGDGKLVVALDAPVSGPLQVGQASAVFCVGTCFHQGREIRHLEISVDGRRHPATAFRMPRPELFRALHPDLAPEQERLGGSDPDSEIDPQLRSYRSGFWATVPVPAPARAGSVRLQAIAQLEDGLEASASLIDIEVLDAPRSPPWRNGIGESGRELIAICMATYQPDMDLFRVQLDSIRRQSDTDWACVISDDCSSAERFQEIQHEVAGDSRFRVSRSSNRLGFYRNFERALGMAPCDAELIALCDQDDHWYPDKLESLRRGLENAQLVYSDMRLVDYAGNVLAESMWEGRRNNRTNLASLLIVNSITGAATLFRRNVLKYALPFPETPGWHFHDHWLALVALSAGDVAYVDRPLYDYVQHEGAILGKMTGKAADSATAGGRGSWRDLLAEWRGFFSRWRNAYFGAYLRLEVQARVLLERCSAELTPRKRRALGWVAAADRSPFAFAWLALRPVRALLGRSETLASEPVLAKGVLWHHLIRVRAGGRSTPGSSKADASMPPTFESFGHRRLRRWRTQA